MVDDQDVGDRCACLLQGINTRSELESIQSYCINQLDGKANPQRYCPSSDLPWGDQKKLKHYQAFLMVGHIKSVPL